MSLLYYQNKALIDEIILGITTRNTNKYRQIGLDGYIESWLESDLNSEELEDSVLTRTVIGSTLCFLFLGEIFALNYSPKSHKCTPEKLEFLANFLHFLEVPKDDELVTKIQEYNPNFEYNPYMKHLH